MISQVIYPITVPKHTVAAQQIKPITKSINTSDSLTDLIANGILSIFNWRLIIFDGNLYTNLIILQSDHQNIFEKSITTCIKFTIIIHPRQNPTNAPTPAIIATNPRKGIIRNSI